MRDLCPHKEFTTEAPLTILSREAIEEFKQIYREEFGETISDADALEMGLRLLRLFEIIYRQIPGDRQNGKDCSY